jgi:hypothetical protein
MNNDRTNICNKDWKKIARASGMAIPDSALDRIAQSLDALEADFRPLVRALPPDTEPAIAFHAVLPAAAHQEAHQEAEDAE